MHFLSGGGIGGKERAQYQLLKSLRDEPDVDVGVAVSNESGHFIEQVRRLGIPIIDLRIHRGYDLLFKPRVIREFRKYDIHHLHDAAPNILLYSLLAGPTVLRIFTRRGGMIDFSILNWKKKLKFHIVRTLIRCCQGYTGNSANAVRSLVEQYGIAADRVALLYNGIDPKSIKTETTREAARMRLGVYEKEFVVGTACHLIRWKRVDLLLRAFAACRVPTKKLYVFGRGPLEGELRKLTTELHLEDRVVFEGEVTSLSDHLMALDCFVLASSTVESFGNAVVEAMFLELPVIVMHDGGGLLEHVTDGETGLVAYSEPDLAGKIEWVSRNPDTANTMAKKGAKNVASRYSMESMVRAYKSIYRKTFDD